VAVLASGRGTNFKAIANSCADEGYPAEVACLITDRPGAHAVEVARRFGIPVHVVDAGRRRGRLQDGAEEEIVRRCDESNVDLVVLAGFMRILRGPLLESFAGRIMNIHPSLLPAVPGLHAQRQALEYGVKVAGCTVHFVDQSVDGGAIILQSAVPVEDDDDEETLSQRILVQEHLTLSRAVELFARGKLETKGRRVRVAP
jgi:phosphoribosylglycinamide formyltransferase-1